MRTKIVAGNWKMNLGLAEATVLARGVLHGTEHIERITTVLCPPTIWLTELAHHVVPPGRLPHLKLGAQNMYFEESGAYTGETSPLMLAGMADYVIVGHSERVHLFHESMDLIGAKVEAALAHGLTPILCVGEEHEDAQSATTVVHHLNHLIKGVRKEDLDKVVVAYEPVWAIGTGKAATPGYVERVLIALRSVLTPNVRLLYGGSVNEENARGYLELADCDGFLIGGTSLKLKPFLQICQLADDIAGTTGHLSLHPTK